MNENNECNFDDDLGCMRFLIWFGVVVLVGYLAAQVYAGWA